MAKTIGEAHLRSILKTPETIRENPFEVLKSIAEFVNDSENETIGREMVLRALEWKEHFEIGREVIDALARTIGMYPHTDPEALDLRDRIAYEYHKPDNMPSDLVFHREQAEIYRRLWAGDNLILSAPTSFGKSRIIDAMIASGKYRNIAVIVPTLALIDETRRRLSTFNSAFKIVTHVSQKPSAKNIFVFTAERAVAYERFPKIDFFVIDEFYKIGELEEDEARTIALNEAFYRLRKGGGQFYMLGPNIETIPNGLEAAFRCSFHQTKFATVVIETVNAPGTGKQISRLTSFVKPLKEPTLIFCGSPTKVNAMARSLIEAGIGELSDDLKYAADWIGSKYHRDWIFPLALQHGIGIHHGRLPRSLAQYVVRAFNEGKLRFLICSSTLIEGVNTRAKNVLIWDTSIANRQINFFTFNNIKGRSGRMFQHFVGRVVLFEDAPVAEDTHVNFPVFTQEENAPTSLLIQMADEDLTVRSRSRVKKYAETPLLRLEVMQKNKSINPDFQIAMAAYIQREAQALHQYLSWTGFPKMYQLKMVCELIWGFFVREKRQKNGISSGKQLAVKMMQISETKSTAARIKLELKAGEHAAKTADVAVERVLQIERHWAEFDFPRYLMATSRIQAEVFPRFRLAPGDYTAFAAMVESRFQAPVLTSLDEYGIPHPVALKIQDFLGSGDDLDTAIQNLKVFNLADAKLSRFEKELVMNAREAL